jgi:hypothetical protein
MMRIRFHKVSDHRHVLELVRADGRAETMSCETRSYLQHDLLHHATEGEARLEQGFWGYLARGTSLEKMNERTGPDMTGALPGMLMIEQIVGVLTGVVKGRSPEEAMAALQQTAEHGGWTMPDWLTADFISRVQERLRQLQGRWRATPFGGTMELTWPP